MNSKKEMLAKLEVYKRKMEKYRKLMEQEQQGGANVGIKLIAFNKNEFPLSQLDELNRADFPSTEKLAKMIGNKAYIIENGKTIAEIFGSTGQTISRTTANASYESTLKAFKAASKGFLKADILETITKLAEDKNNRAGLQPINVSNKYEYGRNDKKIFEEIHNADPYMTDYIIVDFKFLGKNVRMI